MTTAAPAGTDVGLLGYHFVARGPELRIEHEFVETVVVRLEPFAFIVDPPSEDRATLRPGAEPAGPVSFDLCDADKAARHVLQAIGSRRRRRVAPLPETILQGHLLAARNRGLRRVNPDAHRVQRAVLSVGSRVPRLACEPRFYEEPYLVADVVRYRAAACALASLEEHLFEPWCIRRRSERVHRVEGLLAAMRDWRALFSCTGRPYRSLNRTLMNLPDGVPAELLRHLRTFELERPLTGPRGLTAALLHASDGRAARLAETALHQRKILERATEGEIADAVSRIGDFTERGLQPDRLEDLDFAIRFLIDYPAPFRGRLDGLVHRAIRWHEELREPRRGPQAAPSPAPIPGSHPSRRTARPPIPLPEVRGIEFLDTVDRIRAEARLMDNCIASYAGSAVAGDCYLFHVEHRGEHAAIEVDPRGNVRQAEGPANSANLAAEWGAQQLRGWGRGISTTRRTSRGS